MAIVQQIASGPAIDLAPGMVLTLDAINLLTGETVPGIIVSEVVIEGESNPVTAPEADALPPLFAYAPPGSPSSAAA